MDEIYVVVKESQRREQRRARTGVWRDIRDGRMPGTDAMAVARGVVIRERENSIFSDAWVPVALIILAAGIIANRNSAIMAIGITLIVIALISHWWKHVALAGVTYTRTFDQTHVFPDEPVKMTLTIANQKPLPLSWLQFRDEVPVAPEEAGQISVFASEITGNHFLQTTLTLGGFERTRRVVTLRFPKRGYYQLGPVSYQSGDIFTLFTVERQHRYLEHLVVYPRVWPLDALSLPAKEMFGELKVRRSLFTDPIKTQGIRDYQTQDRFRDVHWKATARQGNLQTKVYDPSSGLTVVVFLNVATYPKHWMGFDPELMERAVSVTASIANFAAGQKWGVGVFANGSVPGSDQPIRVSPGRAPEQLIKILEALAAVTEFATGSIELMMHRESSKLPWAATFVLVTGVVTDEMLIGLLRLKEAGRRVTLISLAEEAPPTNLRGILTYHVPGGRPAFQRGRLSENPTEAALDLASRPETISFSQDNPADERRSDR